MDDGTDLRYDIHRQDIMSDVRKHVRIYTGLRLGDCALLEWGHIDLARGFISVIPRKTAVQAIVGHTNPAMTAHYFHKDENALKSATAAIPDVIDVETVEVEKKAPMLIPSQQSGYLDEFKALVAKMSKEERVLAIEHLKSLVA